MVVKSVGLLPLVVIVGPTASGKTAIGIKLAKQFGGEIICADSRTVYRGMDIGTAKPTLEEQAAAPHWGIDLVNPGEGFSAAQFKNYATEKILDIRARGKIPFVVGGTGLYVDSLLFDFQFGGAVDESLRQELESRSLEELHLYCESNNIELPENKKNRRYVIRSIERNAINIKSNSDINKNTIVVGIATPRDTLRTRIEFRAEQLFSDNVVKEATSLGEKYGWDSEAMTGNIYSLVRAHLAGEIDDNELKSRSIVSDWRLAKRQMTWFRRNPHVLWGDPTEIEHYLSDYLANK